MSAQWVTSAAGLPQSDEAVEFVLDGREVAMVGTYVQQTFWSRWSSYDVQRVRTWRVADSGSFGATSARRTDAFQLCP
jgi:hypothetical protein